MIGAPEERILRLLEDKGDLTLSEIVEETGYSRSWAWKLVRRLERAGAVIVEKHGGILRVSLPRPDPDRLRVLRIGILRAAEYPYVVELRRRLRERWGRVEVRVYDDPYRLQALLAAGRVHLAMIPAVTALIAYRITRGSVRIVAGGSGGGAAIIENPSARGEGHVTTMASSMEMCAETHKLPGPRVYAGSGDEILEAVLRGRVRYGVVWYPYVEIARRRGLRVVDCALESCCVMAANSVMEQYYDIVKREMAESISWARRRLKSRILAGSLARLIGMNPELVYASMRAYRFYEEPPLDVLERSVPLMRAVTLPDNVVRDAVVR